MVICLNLYFYNILVLISADIPFQQNDLICKAVTMAALVNLRRDAINRYTNKHTTDCVVCETETNLLII